MKKAFTILNVFLAVATVIVVGLAFYVRLDTGRECFDSVYSYNISQNTTSVSTDIDRCAEITDRVFSSYPSLKKSKIEYLKEASKTLSVLNKIGESVSFDLMFDNKKSREVNEISNEIRDLEVKRDSLLNYIRTYIIKMNGNTYGDPDGTYELLYEEVRLFTESTRDMVEDLVNYTSQLPTIKNQTSHNIFKIYCAVAYNFLQPIDFDSMKTDDLETMRLINNQLAINDFNMETSNDVFGGVYSAIAEQFNQYFSKINLSVFAKKYREYALTQISPSDTRLEYLTYYYLSQLLEVG